MLVNVVWLCSRAQLRDSRMSRVACGLCREFTSVHLSAAGERDLAWRGVSEHARLDYVSVRWPPRRRPTPRRRRRRLLLIGASLFSVARASHCESASARVLDLCRGFHMGIGTSAARAADDEALLYAVALNDEEEVARLIDRDANINHISKDAEHDRATPCILAVQDDALGCLQLLLECSDLEYDRGDQWGLTPLHHGARLGREACVDALLAAGADPAIRARDGSTPLHQAVSNDHAACARLLLLRDAPALLDARDDQGRTALQLARLEDACTCEQLLMDAMRELGIEQPENAAAAGDVRDAASGERAQLLV